MRTLSNLAVLAVLLPARLVVGVGMTALDVAIALTTSPVPPSLQSEIDEDADAYAAEYERIEMGAALRSVVG